MRSQMKALKNHGQHGFTLVELMVVVAIIGILAAVAGPRIQSFRAKGVQAEAKSNLHSIYLAMIAFEDSNDSFPVGAVACADNAPCGPAGNELTFRQVAGSKYQYGFSATADMFIAGAASRRPILQNQRDRWIVNTNKIMCSDRDVTDQASLAARGGGASGCTLLRGGNRQVADTGIPAAPQAAQDAKQ